MNVASSNAIDIIRCESGFQLDEKLLSSDRPILLKGLVREWPVVEKAMESAGALVDYLSRFYSGLVVPVVTGEPNIEGRVAYTDDLGALNCVSYRQSLFQLFEKLLNPSAGDDNRLYYLGTSSTRALLPGFKDENDLAFEKHHVEQFIWIGNRSCVPAHYDLPNNVACNVVGRRRFTLFPPDQIDNLYVGPIDFTPAGQAISLVDIRHPDLDKFPRYVEAEKNAISIELDVGDAIFIPSMWWHHVEALEDVNILVNYWWRQAPPYMCSPADALDLAILSIRDLPASEKEIWRKLFDYYIFDSDDTNFKHIPDAALGSLGELTEEKARQIRAKILAKLNR